LAPFYGQSAAATYTIAGIQVIGSYQPSVKDNSVYLHWGATAGTAGIKMYGCKRGLANGNNITAAFGIVGSGSAVSSAFGNVLNVEPGGETSVMNTTDTNNNFIP
jgi:hypothetical protein